MNKLHTLGLVAALGLAGAAIAQEPPVRPDSDTRETEEKESGRVTPGETPTEGAEGAVQDAEEAVRDAGTPRPSTSQTEGTAADRTAPGETPTASGRTARSPGASEEAGKELVGASVVTRSNTQLGEVTDVVFDARQQPAFVIISTDGESAAVPYAAASSMMSGDKVVIDQTKLQAAPRVKQGEWRDKSSAKWQAEAKRYWERG